jgi:hypothetical protein
VDYLAQTSCPNLHSGLTKARRYDGEYGAGYGERTGTLAAPSMLFPWNAWKVTSAEDHEDETYAVCFDPHTGERRSPVPSGRAVKSARPGCRRERHSSGTGECARTQRLGQRSQRHRQRGQSAGAAVANDSPDQAARRIAFCRLLTFADAAGGKDKTNAICNQISSRGGQSARARASQTARPRDDQHLQGMLSSVAGIASAPRALL